MPNDWFTELFIDEAKAALLSRDDSDECEHPDAEEVSF